MRRSLVAAATAVAFFASAAPASAYDRVAGTNQYETAVAVSQQMVGDPAESQRTAVVVAGDDGADVLVAPVISEANSYPQDRFHWQVPVLMVRADRPLEGFVEAELRRLELQRVVVVGGSNRVSRAVEDRVRTFVPDVQRMSGADRYETAAIVAQRYTQPGGRVFVVTGEANTEAVAGVDAAVKWGDALLLTRKDSLPRATADELRRLAPSEVVVVGNAGVVSASTQRAVEAAVPGVPVRRISGADRYATSVELHRAFDDGNSGFVDLVSGETWMNALVAIPHAASQNVATAVVLTRKGCVPGATLDHLAATGLLESDVRTVIGGPGNVSEAAAQLTRC